MENEEYYCGICREEYTNIELDVNLECNHQFHIECLKKQVGDKCPLCRKPIKTDKISNNDLQIMRNRQQNTINDTNNNFYPIIKEMFDILKEMIISMFIQRNITISKFTILCLIFFQIRIPSNNLQEPTFIEIKMLIRKLGLFSKNFFYLFDRIIITFLCLIFALIIGIIGIISNLLSKIIYKIYIFGKNFNIAQGILKSLVCVSIFGGIMYQINIFFGNVVTLAFIFGFIGSILWYT